MKGLGGGDFVDQMQPDKQLILTRWQGSDFMKVPDFVKQIFSHKSSSLSFIFFLIVLSQFTNSVK
jgi:hypothetical protein